MSKKYLFISIIVFTVLYFGSIGAGLLPESFFRFFGGGNSQTATVIGATNFFSNLSASQGTANKDGLTIELDYPSYQPDFLRHPQRIFSGRKLRIISGSRSFISPQKGAELKQYDITGQSAKIVKTLDLQKGKKPNVVLVDIPGDTPSGLYVLEFKIGTKVAGIPIVIDGSISKSDKSKTSLQGVLPKKVTLDNAVKSVKRLNCQYCYWESVSGTNPLNRDYGYFFGGGASDYSAQTQNGWSTSTVNHLNSMTNPLLKLYRGDPIFAFNQEGKLILASLLYKGAEPITGGIWEENEALKVPSSFHQTLLSSIPEDLDKNQWIVFDYPRIAIDTYEDSPFFKSVYVFANAVYFNELKTTGTGLFIVRNGSASLHKTSDIGFIQPPNDALVGPGGVIYIGKGGLDTGVEVYSSTDGGKSFTKNTVTKRSYLYCAPRVSTKSNRATGAYAGPALASDSQGRIYAVWSEPKECIQDSDFEYGSYAYDYDVYISFSDDKGKIWSAPNRVNDDVGSGNQSFSSIAVDETDNSVYVAFLDHRDNQDKSQFDVYMAKSSDRGATFSRNIRVNDTSVPLTYGGRQPGDYLYMLSIGKDNVFVAHPCVATVTQDNSLPSDACVSVVSKESPDDGNRDAPVISTTETLSGRAGDVVVIKGVGFKPGDKVMISNPNISSISVDADVSQRQLSFKIPGTFPSFCGNKPCELTMPTGLYSVQVLYDDLRSSSVPLNVLAPLSSSIEVISPSIIQSITGPTSILPGDKTYTWTMLATDPDGTSFNYEVDWGNNSKTKGVKNYTATGTPQTIPFTRNFPRAGIFKPLFTLTDADGLAATSSPFTITVATSTATSTTPITATTTPSIIVISPTENQVIVGKAGTTIDVRWAVHNWPSDRWVNIELLDRNNKIVTKTTNQDPSGSYSISINVNATTTKTYRVSVYGGNSTDPSIGPEAVSGWFNIVPSTPTSTAIKVLNSSLALTYDSNQKEASLKAVVEVSVAAGLEEVKIPEWGFLLKADDGAPTHTTYSSGLVESATGADKQPNQYSVSLGQTATFKLTAVFDPKIMFAGSYKVDLQSVFFGYPKTQKVVKQEVSGKATNAVAIIGEQSPYISEVTPLYANMSDIITITGVRFSPYNNRITLGEVNFTVPSSNNGATISFSIPRNIGVVTGWQPFFVTNMTMGESAGKSNVYYVNLK